MSRKETAAIDARAFLCGLADIVLAGVPPLLESAKASTHHEHGATTNHRGRIAAEALSKCAAIVTEAVRRLEQPPTPAG